MKYAISMRARLALLGAISVIAVVGTAGTALAASGEFAKFNDCPSTTAGVFKCLYSVTTGGEIILGNKKTPIVHPVTLQGGVGAQNEENEAEFYPQKFYAASDGNTLSKTPEPVPGGLLGIIPPENTPEWLKSIIKGFTENGLTGVNATLELARPASEIVVSEFALTLEEGVALKLPVRIHLENPFLGSECYVGSSSSPIIWNLTTGTTSPPPPNKPISGTSGILTTKEKAEIAQLTGAKLVDNAWSAPAASGCGGILSFAVDPIIDASVGVPAAAGKNTAELINTIDIATAYAVNHH